MTDAPELERLFDPIRQAMADMEARALRFGYIEATIRVNAMRHGATDAQIEDFIAGRADFIGWIAEKVERPTPDPRVAALVGALGYYADAATYVPDKEYANQPWPIFDDEGALARAALAAFRGADNG
jgi:hypothetical protein